MGDSWIFTFIGCLNTFLRLNLIPKHQDGYQTIKEGLNLKENGRELKSEPKIEAKTLNISLPLMEQLLGLQSLA